MSRFHSAEATADKCWGFYGAPKVGAFLLFLGRPTLSFTFNNLQNSISYYNTVTKYMKIGNFSCM